MKAPTRREKQILLRLSKGAFIWFVDGAPGIGYQKQCWQYPALCEGKEIQRITRIMLARLVERRWIVEGRSGGSYDLTDKGRKDLKGFLARQRGQARKAIRLKKIGLGS